jgi:alkylhydroperoxidase family enzyme
MFTGVGATNERRSIPRIQPVDPESAPEGSRPLMEQAAEGAGKMLNFYRTFAVSPTAFEGYMDLNATLKDGALDRRMQESIAVAVSDFNGCAY